MTNQSLVETVNAFIEDIQACNCVHEIEVLLESKDAKIHGLHTHYNSIQDLDKADDRICEAVKARIQELK